jgi:hypothetical protein
MGAMVGSISWRPVKKCKIGTLFIGSAVYTAIFLNTDLTDGTDKNGSEFLGQIRFYRFYPLNPCSKKSISSDLISTVSVSAINA